MESAFYIGTSLTVVTRSVESAAAPGGDAASVKNVIEFNMDEGKLRAREEASKAGGGGADAAVYCDTATWRVPALDDSSSANSNMPPDLRRIVTDLNLEGPGSFTYVALKVKSNFSEDYYGREKSTQMLYRQIAHTYHYKMHPSTTPRHVLESYADSTEPKPVHLHMWMRGHATGYKHGEMGHAMDWVKRYLNDDDTNLEEEYCYSEVPTFEFEMTLKHKGTSSKKGAKEGEDEEMMDHPVRGIIRYCKSPALLPFDALGAAPAHCSSCRKQISHFFLRI